VKTQIPNNLKAYNLSVRWCTEYRWCKQTNRQTQGTSEMNFLASGAKQELGRAQWCGSVFVEVVKQAVSNFQGNELVPINTMF